MLRLCFSSSIDPAFLEIAQGLATRLLSTKPDGLRGQESMTCPSSYRGYVIPEIFSGALRGVREAF